MKKSTAASTKYFSREFPSDVEVEWKASLATLDPVRFILGLEMQLDDGTVPNFARQRNLGNRDTSVAFLGVVNHYYGHRDDSGKLRQAFVLLQFPGGESFAPHVKFDDGSRRNRAVGNILLRHEATKPGRKSFVPMDERQAYVDAFAEREGVPVEYVGSMHRERTSLFANHKGSLRNWSVVADLSRPVDNSSPGLGQVEVEYKGRGGTWLEYNEATQGEAIAELAVFGDAIINASGGIIEPTSQTKFEWLVAHNQMAGSGPY